MFKELTQKAFFWYGTHENASNPNLTSSVKQIFKYHRDDMNKHEITKVESARFELWNINFTLRNTLSQKKRRKNHKTGFELLTIKLTLEISPSWPSNFATRLWVVAL